MFTKMKTVIIGNHDLNSLCRLCLNTNAMLVDLFTFSNELNDLIVDTLMKCAPVHVNKNDKLPKNICKSCYAQLKMVHNFQVEAIQSEKALHRYLKSRESEVDNNENQGSSDDVGDFFKLELSDESPNYQSKIKQEVDDEIINTTVVRSDKSQSLEDSTLYDKTNCNIKREIFRNDDDDDVDSFNDDVMIKKSDAISFCSVVENTLKRTDSEINLAELLGSDFKPHQCDVCNMRFEREIELTNHKHVHTGESLMERKASNIRCEICNKTFTKLYHLKWHARVHARNLTVNLKRKSKRYQIDEKSFQCNVCSKMFARLYDFNIHQRVHTGEKPYKCDLCGRRFNDPSNMRKHKRNHPSLTPKQLQTDDKTQTKQYECDICSKRFSDPINMEKHKRKHPLRYDQQKQHHQCEVCNKLFARMYDLKIHQRAHTGEKPHQCDICGKCFNDPSNMRKHKRKHPPLVKNSQNKEIPFGNKPHECEVCNKRFARMYDLKVHKRRHTGEKPHQCDICGKCFSESGNMKKHKRKHPSEMSQSPQQKHIRSGDKPHQCDICGKCFNDPSNMKRHKRQHTLTSDGTVEVKKTERRRRVLSKKTKIE